MEDSEDDLTKLINQLARNQDFTPDPDVVNEKIKAFKRSKAEILAKLDSSKPTNKTEEKVEENSVAKLVEEIKTLPARVAERLEENSNYQRKRRKTRMHPMMFEEMLHMAGDSSDPVGILMAASLIREDAPWLYELAMEVYRTAKTGNVIDIENEINRVEKFKDLTMRGPFMEEFGFLDKESHMMVREFPSMLTHMLHDTLMHKKRKQKLGEFKAGHQKDDKF